MHCCQASVTRQPKVIIQGCERVGSGDETISPQRLLFVWPTNFHSNASGTNTVERKTGYETTTSQTATQLQPMLSSCGSTITGAFHHCLYIIYLSNVNTTSATPLLDNSTVLLTIKCHYSVTITRTNQIQEYNSMHVSLGFLVHNNHPCPQGWVYFEITVCASLVPRLSFPTHQEPGYEVKYVRVYRALEFMPVYIYGLQYVTSIVAILPSCRWQGYSCDHQLWTEYTRMC